MTTVYDADANELIEKAAEELKNVPDVKPPKWAAFVKTGMHKERPPVSNDWWYVRVAAVLRAIYARGPIGTSKLRIKYGGKKNMGVRPDHFFKGSGSIIRKAIQQLEKAGFVAQVSKKGRKGRTVTAKGKSFLDKIASKIVMAEKKQAPKVEEKKEEIKKEELKEVKEEKPAKMPERKVEEIKPEKPKKEKPTPKIKEKPKEEPKKKAEKPKLEEKKEEKPEEKNE